MSITITGKQRDVLFEHILIRLTGISDVYLAAENQDLEAAELLGAEFADYLLLLSTDLGWEDHRPGPVQLNSPSDVLRRALGRLKQRAEAEHCQEAELRAEVHERQQRNRAMRETCEELLTELRGD